MLSIEIQLFGLRRTNNKKLFVSLPKADDTSQEAAPMSILSKCSVGCALCTVYNRVFKRYYCPERQKI